MSKDTVLEMTLPKELRSPGDMKETLDTPKPPVMNPRPSAPVDRTNHSGGGAAELNGFGNNMKEQLIPSAPAVLDIDRQGLSPDDTERLEILSRAGEEKTEHEDEDGIGFRLGIDSVHDGDADNDGKWLWPDTDEPDFAIDDRMGDDKRTVITEESPNVNTYQQKKNLAQGMMDLALLSANANQLRYVLESSSGGHPYFYSSITLISFSIILQIAVGIGLILNSRYDVNHHVDICKADKINNMTVLGVFLVTIVNVFITSFSVAPSNTGAVGAT